ncbi:hypothetical protein PM082_006139 [Marasmius tenuissimus]|nr:hypothetical protein PM082_006139 [Marasmius tenuissimus]
MGAHVLGQLVGYGDPALYDLKAEILGEDRNQIGTVMVHILLWSNPPGVGSNWINRVTFSLPSRKRGITTGQ